MEKKWKLLMVSFYFYFVRIKEFDQLLSENVIDIRKLRRLCFNGT